MAFILQNSDDRRIQVGGEELLRPLSFGTNWTRLRVGYRFRLNASFTIPAGILMVGLCQGAQGFLSPSTTDYLGMQVGNVVAGVIWTMTTGGAYPYVVMGNNSITYRKVASVITTQEDQRLYHRLHQYLSHGAQPPVPGCDQRKPQLHHEFLRHADRVWAYGRDASGVFHGFGDRHSGGVAQFADNDSLLCLLRIWAL